MCQYRCKNGRQVVVDIKIDTVEVSGDKGMMLGAQCQNPGRQAVTVPRSVGCLQLSS
jgi:hypothetical protein